MCKILVTCATFYLATSCSPKIVLLKIEDAEGKSKIALLVEITISA